MSEVTIVKQGQTHKGQYPPKMFEPNTLDLAKQATTFGLDAEAVKSVNIKRYMRNLEVLENNGMKLAIMPEQTNEMVLTALYQDIKAFKFVSNQTPEVCEYALSVDPAMIQYFHEQTDEQIIYSIGGSVTNIQYVKNPKIEHIKFALSINVNDTLNHLNKSHITDEVIKFAIDELEFEFSRVQHAHNFGYNHRTPLLHFCNQELVDYAISKNILFVAKVDGQYLTKDIVMQILDIDIKFIDVLEASALNLLDYKVIFSSIKKTGWGYYNIDWFPRVKNEYLTVDLIKEFVSVSEVTYDKLDGKLKDRLKELTDDELIFIWSNGIDIGDIYGRPITEKLVKHTFRGAAKLGMLKNQMSELSHKGKEFKYIKVWWAILAKLRLL